MKKTTKIALAFVALAGLAGGTAIAKDGYGKFRDHREHSRERFEKADADQSGDLTFEEFQSAFQERIGGADANNDGTLTVSEIADEILRRRAERMAKRIVERFDADGDGQLTTAEIESHQKKMFALLDRNDDGKVEMDEVGRRGMGRHHGFGDHDGMGRHHRYDDD